MGYKPRKLVKESVNDPENSVSLFDANRLNELGEMYCVAPDILYEQVDYFWGYYLGYMNGSAEEVSTDETHTSTFNSITEHNFEDLSSHEIELIIDELNKVFRNRRVQEEPGLDRTSNKGE